MPPPGILEMSEELSQGFPAPVKLSQTCKTEPLMKYINLEHCACIHSIVLFAYKPPCGGGGKEERLRGGDTLDKHVIEGKECAATWWLGNTDASQCLLQGLNRWNALSDTTDTTDREEEGGEKKKKKTELSQDHICLADTADVPTDRWVRMSYCVSGFFGKGFKNAFIQSHVFWDDLVSLTFCETQNGI